MTIKFVCNNEDITLETAPGVPALDIIRNDIGFTGCREGCREGECGACTVLVGSLNRRGTVSYRAAASCMIPAAELSGRHIVSVEGIFSDLLSPQQKYFMEAHASQCGFCTPGFLVSLTGFFFSSPDLSEKDALVSIDGNICRCTGYASIKRAVRKMTAYYRPLLDKKKPRLDQLISWRIVPEYFRAIPMRLEELGGNGGGEKPAEIPENAVLISGGTDLYIQKGRDLESNEHLYLLSRRTDLDYVRVEGRKVRIGGAACVDSLRFSAEVNQLLPSIKDDLLLVSSSILRSRASIAGNIVNASPIADMAVYLLPFRPVLELSNGSTVRTVRLEDFYLGYKDIDMEKNEVITEISFIVPQNCTFSFSKVSRRKILDIASVNSAFCLVMENGCIVSLDISGGGLAPVPLLFAGLCSKYAGSGISAALVKMVIDGVLEEICPIDDVRGSAEYKKRLFINQLIGQFCSAAPDLLKAEDLVYEL